MYRLRNTVFLISAFAMAAFALPASAHYVSLVMTAVAPGTLTATITNKTGGGNYTINSIKLPFGTNVGSVASVAVTGYTGTGSTSGVTVSGSYVLVPNVNLANNKSITLTLSGVKPSSGSCGSTSTRWTVQAYENSNYSGFLYILASSGNNLTVTLTSACYTVGGSTNAGGTVTCSPSTVAVGASSLCSVAINPGYTLSGFSSNCGAPSTATSCTVSNVQSNQVVTASFNQIPYAINGSTSPGGMVTCTPTSTFYNGGGTCTVSTNPGWTFVSFSSNCAALNATQCAVSNVHADVNVMATFTQNQYTVNGTAIPSAGGSVSCTSPVTYGQSSTCTATVNANWTLTGFTNCAPATATSCTVSGVQDNVSNVTANYVANTMAITSTQKSAAVSPAPPASPVVFPVTVTLTGGPDATVTLDPTGCPAFTGSLSTAAVNGVATFGLTFGAVGNCTLSAHATNYNAPANPLSFVVFAVADPGCNTSSFPTSMGPDQSALDPSADQAYLTPGWGLRRFDDTTGAPANPSCAPGVNFTLTTGTDPDGSPTASLVYDKASLPTGGNFKYVIVLDPRPYPADGWPALHPLVAWNTGTPDYVPGLACLSDDNETLGSAVMPTIPPGFVVDPNYPIGSAAKMCIAQVGWTPVSGGIQYWVKVIDQSDGGVKFP
jgi:Divergent InlB B-repeat domain